MRSFCMFLLVIFFQFSCHTSGDNKIPDANTFNTPHHTTVQAVEKGYAPINGLRMYYEVYGSGGMPLVLIHGGGSTIQTTFENILPLLSGHYKIIAVELQAHGRTNDRDTASSFEQDADDVVALLAYLKIDKANFFGFSNGGNTSMQIGIRHPEIVNKLVIASSFYQRAGMMPGFFEGMQRSTFDSMPLLYKEAFLKVDSNHQHLHRMYGRDSYRMLHFTDWTENDMKKIKTPVLLLFGDHDVVTLEHAMKMYKVLPNARLTIFPAAHGEYLGELMTQKKDSKIPGMTADLVNEFLQ